MSELAKVARAYAASQAAEEAFVAAVERAYPIGTELRATLGRARIHGVVTGHGGPGYYAGYITVTNIVTDKPRRFFVGDRSLHDVAVESTPPTISSTEGANAKG